MAQESAIHLSGVTKRYPGVVANKDVEFDVAVGEVHAVVGENGAGKSTLMKIIYGMVRPDEGIIRIRGKEVHFRSPKDAIDAGIGMVHQHFMLADNFTVLENIILGSEPMNGVQIDFQTASDRIKELGEKYGLRLDPGTRVETLSVGERQRVEIIKVLYRGARILILDEPTAVLVPQEVDDLFDSIRELKAEGETVIFISHKLDEVLTIADSITVMRAGETVGTTTPDQIDAGQLAEMMIGSELPTPETRTSTVQDEVVLEVVGLSLQSEDDRDLLSDISFTIHKGEIVGIAKEMDKPLWWTLWSVSKRRPPGKFTWQGRTSPTTRPGIVALPVSVSYPKIGNDKGSFCLRRCGRTPRWGIRTVLRTRKGRGSTKRERGLRPRKSSDVLP
jgi:simple sugar transport system ATP-binding protein